MASPLIKKNAFMKKRVTILLVVIPMKLWRIAFGLRPSHLTLGKAMQASLSSRLIGTLMMLAAFSLASRKERRYRKASIANYIK
jgi:hypothetical protein